MTATPATQAGRRIADLFPGIEPWIVDAEREASASAETRRSVHEAWCADAEHRGCVPEDYAPPGAAAPEPRLLSCGICGNPLPGLVAGSAEPRRPSRDELAKALIDSELMTRLNEYAVAANPDSMMLESLDTLSKSWADAILAALREGGEAREP